ncbi:porin [Undibacterium oligocarboniphilum]|uniref:Porin n=1 Tax=Undibacterium oligocarboniphilum TaxID=666702 RepID=A0A850QAY1_9BURK|nr:porin [Undibacterium oligocarboniphilum]MBC3869886.1 porin [Undibacterium oligocarboniphilum]NVO77502.1 porin [Undibacterium oligocarboniphilum]
MKKSFLALALMGAFSGAAFAQSSVTIYGVADVGFQSLDNGTPAGRFSRIQSGQEAGSRLGFKGVEDLGGGLKASFVLEQGILLDTGASDQGGRTFGRTSVVGLSGDFGSLNLGRDKTTTLKFFDNFDPFASALINNGTGIRGLYFVGGTANSADTTGRAGNAVFYGTPNLNGFTALASYGFGEVAGDTSAGRSMGLNLGYKIDALEVGYNFAKDNQQPAAGGINAVKANTLAASYDFGVAKPVAFYQKQTSDAGLDKKVYSLAVTVPVDANSKVLAGFTKVKNDTALTTGGTVGSSKQFALGYSYALSKRTDLYTAYARLTQDAAAKEQAVVAGANVTEFTAGVRHQF